MADEDIIRQFSEALNDYNRVIKDGITEQQKVNVELAKAQKRTEQLNAAFFKGEISEKEYRREREKSNKSAIDSARYYAQAQIEAEKQTKTLSYQFVKMAGTSVDNQKALLRMEQGLKTAGAVLGQLGSSALKFAGGLADGDTKFTSLNPLIDGVTGALGKMAEAVPYAGALLSGALKLAAEGAKFMLGQLQKATDSFQQLSAVGALTVKGMSGVREQFLQSGMTMEGFQKTVIQNAAALARFEGSAGRGAQRFSEIMNTIVDSEVGDQLRRLGFSADAIGETAAGFLEQQTRLGLAQGKTNAQLAKGAAEYARELDALAKLTGMQREEIQKQQQAALSESRFRAKIDQLVGQGKEKEAKALLDFQTMVSKASPEMAQGLRDLATGNATTEAAQQVLRQGGQEILRQVEAGIIGPVEAFKRLQNSTQQIAGTAQNLAVAVGDETKAFTKYSEMSDFLRAKVLDDGTIQLEQDKQQTKGNDRLTDSAANAQKNLEQMSRQMGSLAFEILPNFASVVSKMTDTMRQGLEKMGVKVPSAASVAPGGARSGGASGAGAAGAAPGAAMSRRDLIDQGLRVKAGDVQAEGSGVSPKLIELAKRIQSEVPGFQYFSGFNDRFHQEKSPSSTHTRGLAADFTVSPTPSAEEGRRIADQLRSMGFATVIDEYNNPSAKATAGHFHAAISARNGFQGLISGPKSGYRPNIVMHGTEELSIKPRSGIGSMDMDRIGNSMGEQMNMMGAQLSALENIVSAMRDQNSISNKILQATNN